ncbi:MAG: hypothetical protein KGN76_17500 [Acidobacteriota bacterium]|nr:hypothetical protein [Acidobacteriota bacterium]
MSGPTTDQQTDGTLLPGLDGTNPLGFLAALGVLRAVTIIGQRDRVRLSWETGSGTWVPRLAGSAGSQDGLLNLLDQHLLRRFEQHPLGRLLTQEHPDPVSRREDLASKVRNATHHDHLLVDWLGALTSDGVAPGVNSQLQLVRRDYFSGNVRSVLERTERSHLEHSLFSTWDYADPLDNQSLHFDPGEDRRHALQWNQPSGDPDRKKSGGMLGASRLAVEALPLFTSLPERGRLHTLGFSGLRRDDTRWTWPVWRHPIDLETTRSLLGLPELQQEHPSEDALRHLRRRGVVAVLRTHRILVGKTPNFTPAQRIA